MPAALKSARLRHGDDQTQAKDWIAFHTVRSSLWLDDLSGGQMQRVAVARALVCAPRLILADEPTGQLDRVTASKLVEALLELVAESGAALIVATHDPTIVRPPANPLGYDARET
jgi:ABC-type lipoprotein export system ATPase subunit